MWTSNAAIWNRKQDDQGKLVTHCKERQKHEKESLESWMQTSPVSDELHRQREVEI